MSEIETNPWKITVYGEKAPDTNIVRIKKLLWYPENAGDELIIANAKGDPIWEVMSDEAAPNKENYGRIELDFYGDPFMAEGLKVSQMTGTLYVYLK
jgi:hypothetical protein